MIEPIISGRVAADWKWGHFQSQNLQDLHRLLQLNLQNQQKLKKLRNDTNSRMQGLQEYVATYRLKTEFPPASAIISYIKFERNTLLSYRHQVMIYDHNDTHKNSDEECDFMKQLDEGKPTRKRRDVNFAELPKDPKLINFEQLSRNTTYKCGINLYRAWKETHKTKPAKRPYTAEEDERLIEKKDIYGDNWEKICQYNENRTFEDLYYEYHNRVNPKLTTGKWSTRQSMMLIVLLEHYGAKKWAQIAQKMMCKSELQVRERYCNIIDPNISRDSWTKEMEVKLMEIAKDYNYSWNSIAKLPAFKNKTDNCIWRKFRAIMVKKPREEIEKAIPYTGKRDLIQKILKYKDTIESKKKGTAAMRAIRPRLPSSMRPNFDFISRLPSPANLNPPSHLDPSLQSHLHLPSAIPHAAEVEESNDGNEDASQMLSQQPRYILYP